MQRRDFLVAASVTGMALAFPSALAAARTDIEQLWLVTNQRGLDRVAAAIIAKGSKVIRAPDDASLLWYEHVAPLIGRGTSVRGVSSSGMAFMLEKLGHLQSVSAPTVEGYPTLPMNFEAWGLIPRPGANIRSWRS